MGIFIWIMLRGIALHCTEILGCTPITIQYLEYLIGIGSIELIFELSGVVRIYRSWTGKPPQLPEPKIKSKKRKKDDD